MSTTGAGRNPLLDLTLTEASRLVVKRDVSPLELVDAALARIEQVDGTLKSYISVYEQAREVARHAEAIVVGSAIVHRVATLGRDPGMPEAVGAFARELAQAVAEVSAKDR